jgi:hypothetical protein
MISHQNFIIKKRGYKNPQPYKIIECRASVGLKFRENDMKNEKEK